jgi:hypothetical protein
LEAAPRATWRRVDPFETYKPTSRVRDPDAGPHFRFLNWSKQPHRKRRRLADKAAKLFADEYGLLGLFQEYCSAPVLPEGKPYVAPDAVIDASGRLRPVDPATEGKRRLEDLLHKRDGPHPETGEKMTFNSMMSLPKELRFYPTHSLADLPAAAVIGGPLGGAVAISWEDATAEYGVRAVLDEHADRGVSFVSMRERLSLWDGELMNFSAKLRSTERGLHFDGINESLVGVSPYVSIGGDSTPERGWRCRSLLQAMYLMLYLDITGGQRIRRCNRSGCGTYYRLGPQTNSLYCSKKCTSRASTRLARGQEP